MEQESWEEEQIKGGRKFCRLTTWMSSKISQREKDKLCVTSIIYMKSKKAVFIPTKSRVGTTHARVMRKGGGGGQRYKHPVMNSSNHLMYSLVTIVYNTVLHI